MLTIPAELVRILQAVPDGPVKVVINTDDLSSWDLEVYVYYRRKVKDCGERVDLAELLDSHEVAC